MTVPTENFESEAFANYLRANDYTFTHIANESWLPPKVARLAAIRKKRMGLSPGVPDFMVILKRGSLLFIEMKRDRIVLSNWTKGRSPSKISPEQQAWMDELNKIPNIQCNVSYGHEEAISIIERIENL